MMADNEELVERVARAMVAASRPNADPDKLTPAPRGQVGLMPIWRLYEHMARAAIDATLIEQLSNRVERLERDVIAFLGPWAAKYADEHGLPRGHLHPVHYDLLKDCGARMDDFTRAALTGEHQPPTETGREELTLSSQFSAKNGSETSDRNSPPQSPTEGVK